MKALCLIASLILTATAFAGTADLTWTSATLNTDGSTIPATCTTAPCGRLVSTVVEYGTCSAGAFGVKAGEISTPHPGKAATVNLVVVQTYCFRAKHINDYNESSAFTGVVTKANAAPIPGMPAGFAAAASIAYYSVLQNDKLVMLPVGTVTASTACDATRAIVTGGVTYQGVPSAAVAWYGSVKPKAVFSICS